MALSLLAATSATAQTVVDPALQVDIVVSGLALPTSMAFIGRDDFLVLQKNDGRVVRASPSLPGPAIVLDVAVNNASERGLLGIAVSPDFAHDGLVYLFYTESSTGADTGDRITPPAGNRVYRYRWDGSTLVEPLLVLDLPVTPGPNHDGGIIAFGPDDALYTVIGDLNRNGKLQNFPGGPDPDDTGVILRTDALGRALPDNPFFDPADPENPLGRYFAYGVRNSFGMTFDPVSGALWDTENGPGSYDEINRAPPGFNSGWEALMGPDARDPSGVGDLWIAPGSIYRDPEFSWQVPVAPTAMAFPASPIAGCTLRHDLLVGDNNCGQIYRFRPSPSRDSLVFTSAELQDRVADNQGSICSREAGEILFGGAWGVITDIENGPDGGLYVVSLSRGIVYRIGPRTGFFPDADGDDVNDACDCDGGDPGSFSPPDEVPRLRVSGSGPTTIGWDDQAAVAGFGTTYTVATGDAAALRADGGFASACALAEGLTFPRTTDALPDPPPGTVRYYLGRAANGCADGTYGDGSEIPDPRDLLDAAPLPICSLAGRTGGAFITFRIVDETLMVWSTNDAFIDEARAHLDAGTARIPMFQDLLDGRDGDPQWTWHPDPMDVSFADFAIEVCDAKPSFVEAAKDYWLGTVGQYCPWSAVVTAVDDRR